MSFSLLRDSNPAKQPGEKVHLLELCFSSLRVPLFGFVSADEFSLEAVASIADCFTSKAPIRFLNQIVRDLPYRIHQLYTSTNPIFFGGAFEETCKAAGIEHIAGPTPHYSVRMVHKKLETWYRDVCKEPRFKDIHPNLVLRHIHNELPLIELNGETPVQRRLQYLQEQHDARSIAPPTHFVVPTLRTSQQDHPDLITVHRRLHHGGVRVNSLEYFSRELSQLRLRYTEVDVMFNKRDLGRVNVSAPGEGIITVPAANYPYANGLSLSEHMTRLRQARASVTGVGLELRKIASNTANEDRPYIIPRLTSVPKRVPKPSGKEQKERA